LDWSLKSIRWNLNCSCLSSILLSLKSKQ
jgi:hypothetical protein